MTAGDAGRFTFQSLAPGEYTLNAEAPGLRSDPVSVTLRSSAPSQLQIILRSIPAAPATASSSASGMEFSDQPTFSVAGVTDWTAVGGHGSDATLRTSEDLARETLTLRPPAEARHSLSETERRRERAEEARLRGAVAADPQSYSANRALGEFYLHAARYADAITPFGKASDLDGAKAPDEFNLALACRGLGDPAKARQHMARAVAEQPNSADYHRIAGELDETLGDPLSAVQEESLAAKLDPSEQNTFAWGSELLLHRAIWQAAEVFANGAKAHPASARLKTGWGAALFAAARYDEAAQRLCEASDLDPTNAEPYRLIGEVALAAPAPLACVREKLDRFRATQPSSADANYFSAMSLLKGGDAPNQHAAASLLEKAVVLDPKYAPAYLELGVLASRDHRDAEAIELYNKALAADPQQAEAHFRLGVAYDRTGKHTEAQQQFQQHDQLLAAQAEQVEQARREVKQFVVVPGDKPTTP